MTAAAKGLGANITDHILTEERVGHGSKIKFTSQLIGRGRGHCGHSPALSDETAIRRQGKCRITQIAFQVKHLSFVLHSVALTLMRRWQSRDQVAPLGKVRRCL
jgi:hypothetical protein